MAPIAHNSFIQKKTNFRSIEISIQSKIYIFGNNFIQNPLCDQINQNAMFYFRLIANFINFIYCDIFNRNVFITHSHIHIHIHTQEIVFANYLNLFSNRRPVRRSIIACFNSFVCVQFVNDCPRLSITVHGISWCTIFILLANLQLHQIKFAYYHIILRFHRQRHHD